MKTSSEIILARLAELSAEQVARAAEQSRLIAQLRRVKRKAIVPCEQPSPLDAFIAERCCEVPGALIKFSDFLEEFRLWLTSREIDRKGWGHVVVSRSLPSRFPYGIKNSNQRFVGNI